MVRLHCSPRMGACTRITGQLARGQNFRFPAVPARLHGDWRSAGLACCSLWITTAASSVMLAAGSLCWLAGLAVPAWDA